ncbi:Fatty acid metabolism regulator protein [Jannaschia aquimarina]|uniref:FadR_1 protein n=1 Tax=Jannaschia aquimarina TaxID=935700 RepID=A0A0D1ENW2_9RHOB|nr:Fatty acid metabolism regulator protein [Jannaschia aquimarina]SNT20344.1 transcriptional regulator, TetR family [Jannaschia aquimarina]
MADKRVKRRKEARPAEILDAALAEFEEHGFAKATPAGIARRAGIGRATIYLYFDGKDAVFEALLRQRLIAPLEEIGADMPTADESAERMLRRVFGIFYEEVVGSRTAVLMRILIAEGHRFPSIVELYHRQITETGYGLLRRIVDRGIARGEFRPDIAELDLRVLVGPAMMTVLWQIVFGALDPIDPKRMMADHIKLVMDGIRMRSPQPLC